MNENDIMTNDLIYLPGLPLWRFDVAIIAELNCASIMPRHAQNRRTLYLDYQKNIKKVRFEHFPHHNLIH
jgi:hypothetical protein